MRTLLLVSALVPLLSPQDPAGQRLVLQTPEMAEVEVLDDLPYFTRDDAELLFDVYRPAGMEEGESRPAILVMNASGPPLKDWAQYEDWGRLCAANGLVGITFQARRERTEDFDDLLQNLEDQAEDLGLDPERIGVWACSANARSVVPWVMGEDMERVRCAAFYYGVMSSERLRTDLPVLVARAGKDDAVINDSIDGFVAAALKANAPLTLINHAAGPHGFDVRADTEESRRIIRRTLEFLKAGLVED